MVKGTSRIARVFAAVPMLLAGLAGSAGAATVSVTSVSVDPGGAAVVPISVSSDDSLTLLSVDLTFDAALCQQIANVSVAAAGRSQAAVAEDGVKCPGQGRVRVVILDLLGKTVIPSGDGPVAELVFDVLPGATSGVYPISVRVNQANNGPLTVPLSASDGALAIGDVLSGCLGDCNGDGQVTINELVGAVNVALQGLDVSVCAAADRNSDGTVTIDELVAAVNSGLGSVCAAG